jgi:hypothetical protein
MESRRLSLLGEAAGACQNALRSLQLPTRLKPAEPNERITLGRNNNRGETTTTSVCPIQVDIGVGSDDGGNLGLQVVHFSAGQATS